ncbi:MAG: hypothetical protein EBU90_06415 [Proteobacteria bacterium]|nr:hypothetical protein [Pseudomonadota bacterium]NBP13551.1 hypothetical protein [bacterium]
MAKIIGKDALQGSSVNGTSLSIKGRSSDNTAILNFLNNAESVTQTSLQSDNNGLTLNVPTSDYYKFNVNNIERVNINQTSTNILGRTDGNAAPTNCIGEYRSGLIPITGPATTGASNVTFDVATGFTITPGTWLVGANPILMDRNGPGFNMYNCFATFRSSTGILYPQSTASLGGYNSEPQPQGCMQAIITTTSTIDINLRFFLRYTGAMLVYTYTNIYGEQGRIWAVRIA